MLISNALSTRPAKMSATKVEHKAVYDLGKKELKNRTEVKFQDSGLKVRCPAGRLPP